MRREAGNGEPKRPKRRKRGADAPETEEAPETGTDQEETREERMKKGLIQKKMNGFWESMRQGWPQALSRWLFPLILLVYPLLWADQGIDVSDPTYSLTNFRFFPELSGTWPIATWLANAAGFCS